MKKKTSAAKATKKQPPKPKQTAERKQFPGLGKTLSPYRTHPLGPSGKALPPKPSWKERWNFKKVAKRAGIVLAILILLGGGWTAYKFITNANRVFGGDLFGLLTSQKLRGEDRGRVNILLTGYSADDPGHRGAQLTDSIMIVSLAPQHKTAFILSVPRDLWVEISPDRGYQKINAAYTYGEADKFKQAGYREGGIGNLESIITENFGLKIDYYALVNYAAVRDAVNAVGGITVDIQSSDPRGLYDANISVAEGGPLKLANGVQTLDGQTALNLARARGDSYYSYGFPQSDFNRAENQRKMLIALKSKAVSAGTLSNPVKLGKLFDSFGKNVKTDFKSKEARRLGEILRTIPDKDITSVSLNNVDGKGKNLLASYRSMSGQSALIPALGVDDYTDIQRFLKQLTDAGPPKTQQSSGE